MSCKLLNESSSSLVCEVVYIKSIKFVNLVHIISTVVLEIQGVENNDLTVPINNTLVCHISFFASDAQLCVLIV